MQSLAIALLIESAKLLIVPMAEDGPRYVRLVTRNAAEPRPACVALNLNVSNEHKEERAVGCVVTYHRPLSQNGSRRKRCPAQFGPDGMGSIPATPPSTKRSFHQAECLPLLRFQ